MYYKLIPPPASLATYVKSFWILEGQFTKPGENTYRLMANAFPEMAFHYNNQFRDEVRQSLSLASLDGPSEKYKVFRLDGRFGMIGVCFHPYGIQQIFKVSLQELKNQSIELDLILGKEGKALAEQVIQASNNAQRLEVLTQFLHKKIRSASSIDPQIFGSIQKIYARKGALNMDEITKDVWLSRRQFERKFNELTGIRPKLLARIIRFQTSLKMKEKPIESLSALAYDCGYFDQSHFIRDFKAFSGLSPGIYFKKITESADNFVNLTDV